MEGLAPLVSCSVKGPGPAGIPADLPAHLARPGRPCAQVFLSELLLWFSSEFSSEQLSMQAGKAPGESGELGYLAGKYRDGGKCSLVILEPCWPFQVVRGQTRGSGYSWLMGFTCWDGACWVVKLLASLSLLGHGAVHCAVCCQEDKPLFSYLHRVSLELGPWGFC